MTVAFDILNWAVVRGARGFQHPNYFELQINYTLCTTLSGLKRYQSVLSA